VLSRHRSLTPRFTNSTPQLRRLFDEDTRLDSSQ
jgi:hypothetical protein